MYRIVLVSADPTSKPIVEAVVSQLEGTLQVVQSINKLQNGSMDLILWHTYPFDFKQYEALKVVCPKIIWLIDRKHKSLKLGPRQGPTIPCMSFWFPFLDPEEIALLIKGGWDRI